MKNTKDAEAVGIESAALFDHFVHTVIIPWREQAAIAEQSGDEQRREILDRCCDDLEHFFRSNNLLVHSR